MRWLLGEYNTWYLWGLGKSVDGRNRILMITSVIKAKYALRSIIDYSVNKTYLLLYRIPYVYIDIVYIWQLLEI